MNEPVIVTDRLRNELERLVRAAEEFTTRTKAVLENCTITEDDLGQMKDYGVEVSEVDDIQLDEFREAEDADDAG